MIKLGKLNGIVIDATILNYKNPISTVLGIIINEVNQELRRTGKNKNNFFSAVNKLDQALEYISDEEEFVGIDEIAGALHLVEFESNFNEMIEASLAILEESEITISFRDSFLISDLIKVFNKIKLLNNPKLNLVFDLEPEIVADIAIKYFSKNTSSEIAKKLAINYLEKLI